MDITPFGPDDAAEIADFVELVNAAAAVDAPWLHPMTVHEASGRFRHGWDGEPTEPYLARVDGEVVGWGGISASDYDNLDLAWLDVTVHPAHRRRGHGTSILTFLVDECRRRGRTNLGTDAWDDDGFAAFAAAHGFEPKSQAINRRQYLADVDWSELDKRYDAALPAASDYVIERWPVPTPEERLEQLAEMAAAINDAPKDDLEYDDEVFTGERMRAYEVAMEGRGLRLYRLVARHLPSGGLAGQTVVGVDSERPHLGGQHDTSVTRAHRGHKLGLLLKTDMLRWLREAEPQLEEIDTWNAESNDHMIGVNEVLGYRVMGREIQFQRRL